MIEILDTQKNNDTVFILALQGFNQPCNCVTRYTYPIAPKLQKRFNTFPSNYSINILFFFIFIFLSFGQYLRAISC